MMKIIYEQLREKVKEANSEAINGSFYFDTVNTIRIAEQLAKREGLIGIDPKYGQIVDYIPLEHPIMEVLELVADGTDADQIIEIMLLKYFSNDYKGSEAIAFLMYIVGGLSIKMGEHPDILIKKLENMIPAKAFEAYKACSEST